MKAMILGAGEAARVRPVTGVVPRPMLPIVHQPLLELLVEHLRSHGFDEIVVNTSSLAPQIESYFRDGSRMGVRMAYSFEGTVRDGVFRGEALGSAGGMRRIQDHSGFFDGTFLVLHGGALVDLDLGAFLELHRRRGAVASVAVQEVTRESVSRYGIVTCAEDGRIAGLQERPAPADAQTTLAIAGVFLFEPQVLARVPRGVPWDIGRDLLPELIRSGAAVHAAPLPFQWLDIRSLSDYMDAVRAALEGRIRIFRPSGREVRPGVRFGLNVSADLDRCSVTGPVWVGGSAKLQPGCTVVGPSVIGPGCVIESGAHVERSIVLDHTRVATIANVRDRIACGSFCTDAEGTTIDVRAAGVEWVLGEARNPDVVVPEGARELLTLQSVLV